MEVLIGGEASFLDAVEAQAVGDPADTPDPPGEAADCECLCACVCAGAQLVVAPTAVPPPAGVDAAEAPAEEECPISDLHTPRPPHRPPLA